MMNQVLSKIFFHVQIYMRDASVKVSFACVHRFCLHDDDSFNMCVQCVVQLTHVKLCTR